MNLQMTGIDYTKADLSTREKFTFTKNEALEFMREIKENSSVTGIIMLLTCNRTEIYISYPHTAKIPSIESLLCRFKGKNVQKYKDIFTTLHKENVVHHLYALSCGMKSMIFGESQILTQVKNALEFSHNNNLTDSVLESLFQRAVSSAKSIISEVRLTAVNRSFALDALECLHAHFLSLENVPVLVIGNGMMGILAAQVLEREQAKVFMTVRQYTKGEVYIPKGVQAIPYEDRYTYLEKCKILLSATASPHYTIEYNRWSELANKPECIVDLALPRDIEPKIGTTKGVVLYDIDSFAKREREDPENQNIAYAKKKLREKENEFISWYYFRDYIPSIQQIADSAAHDAVSRAMHYMKNMNFTSDDKAVIEQNIHKASFKAIAKLMYGFKESLDRDLWDKVLESLEQTIEE